jgi:hypothetical protein
MKYRYYRVTAVVAVAQYEADDLCDEHATLLDTATPLGGRTALDAVELLNDSDDLLLELSEEELTLAPQAATLAALKVRDV